MVCLMPNSPISKPQMYPEYALVWQVYYGGLNLALPSSKEPA